MEIQISDIDIIHLQAKPFHHAAKDCLIAVQMQRNKKGENVIQLRVFTNPYKDKRFEGKYHKVEYFEISNRACKKTYQHLED